MSTANGHGSEHRIVVVISDMAQALGDAAIWHADKPTSMTVRSNNRFPIPTTVLTSSFTTLLLPKTCTEHYTS